MHCDARNPQAPGEAATKGRANKQRAKEARTGRVGDGGQFRQADPGVPDGVADQRQQATDMVPTGQFRYDPAVGGMQFNLAVQFFRDQTPFRVVDCHPGFVARSFDSEDVHLFLPEVTARRFCNLMEQWIESTAFFTKLKGFMPHVRVKENEPFDVALRRFKRSCEKAGVLSEVRRREFYEKPTTVRKRKAAAAVKRHQKKLQRETRRFERMY